MPLNHNQPKSTIFHRVGPFTTAKTTSTQTPNRPEPCKYKETHVFASYENFEGYIRRLSFTRRRVELDDLLEFTKVLTNVCFETRKMATETNTSRDLLAESIHNIMSTIAEVIVNPDYKRTEFDAGFFRELLYDVGLVFDRSLKDIVVLLLQETLNEYHGDLDAEDACVYTKAARAYFDVLYAVGQYLIASRRNMYSSHMIYSHKNVNKKNTQCLPSVF